LARLPAVTYLFAQLNPESVAEHTMRTAQLAALLAAEDGGDLDQHAEDHHARGKRHRRSRQAKAAAA
jgi:hypothetical protein